VDYLSGDFDPSFGADRACAESRFLAARGLPWNLMAWTFIRTGNQAWTMKTAPHLCQEVSVTLAQGGAVFLYNQPQRSGRLTAWHQDLFAQVADFCRKRKDYCFKSETIPQVALLHSQTCYYRRNDPLFNFGRANEPMEGALHALLENGYSVDILNEDMFLERGATYPMVVVAEQPGLPERVTEGLRTYAQNGGRLLISGVDVAAELGDLVGVEAVEGARHGAGYVPANNGCVMVSGEWQAVKTTTAAELAPLLYQQEPEFNRHDTAAATVNHVGEGVVVAIHGNVFNAYHSAHYPGLRRFVGDTVMALATPNVIRLHGPWWIEMSARRKDGRTLIQFVNRSSAGHLSPKRHHVEHVPDAGPFTVRIPLEAKPTRCYMAPDEVGLEWTWRADGAAGGGTLTAKVASLAIHNVLVVE
jgi:hypothetical protein